MLRFKAALLLHLAGIESATAFVGAPLSPPTTVAHSDRLRRQPSASLSRRQMAATGEGGGGGDGGIAGSFFNPVPEPEDGDGDDDGDGETPKKEQASSGAGETSKGGPAATSDGGGVAGDDAFDFDRSMAELLKRRNRKPLASKPSTIGGVPTSKATGFGKPQTTRIIKTTSSSTTKKSFVGIGKPLNDVNNPEYDDQGYTLYADEETGEKKRVFEALVDYPCDFTMKIVGANEGAFVAEIVQVVAESCEVSPDDVEHSSRVNGKWTSVTVQAPVKSAEMLYALYENIDRDPRVKFKF